MAELFDKKRSLEPGDDSDCSNGEVKRPKTDFFNILDFSDCVLTMILSYVDTYDLYSLHLTCKRFNYLIRERKLWENVDLRKNAMCGRKFQFFFDHLVESTNALMISGINTNEKCISSFQMYLLEINIRNLTVLAIEYQYINSDEVLFIDFPSTLKEVSLRGTRILGERNFLQDSYTKMTVLHTLILDECLWFHEHCIMGVSKFAALENLSLYKCDNFHDSIAYMSITTKYGFKNLKRLDARLTKIGDQFLKCLNHLKKLREIYLEAPTKKKFRRSRITSSNPNTLLGSRSTSRNYEQSSYQILTNNPFSRYIVRYQRPEYTNKLTQTPFPLHNRESSYCMEGFNSCDKAKCSYRPVAQQANINLDVIVCSSDEEHDSERNEPSTSRMQFKSTLKTSNVMNKSSSSSSTNTNNNICNGNNTPSTDDSGCKCICHVNISYLISKKTECLCECHKLASCDFCKCGIWEQKSFPAFKNETTCSKCKVKHVVSRERDNIKKMHRISKCRFQDEQLARRKHPINDSDNNAAQDFENSSDYRSINRRSRFHMMMGSDVTCCYERQSRSPFVRELRSLLNIHNQYTKNNDNGVVKHDLPGNESKPAEKENKDVVTPDNKQKHNPYSRYEEFLKSEDAKLGNSELVNISPDNSVPNLPEQESEEQTAPTPSSSCLETEASSEEQAEQIQSHASLDESKDGASPSTTSLANICETEYFDPPEILFYHENEMEIDDPFILQQYFDMNVSDNSILWFSTAVPNEEDHLGEPVRLFRNPFSSGCSCKIEQTADKKKESGDRVVPDEDWNKPGPSGLGRRNYYPIHGPISPPEDDSDNFIPDELFVDESDTFENQMEHNRFVRNFNNGYDIFRRDDDGVLSAVDDDGDSGEESDENGVRQDNIQCFQQRSVRSALQVPASPAPPATSPPQQQDDDDDEDDEEQQRGRRRRREDEPDDFNMRRRRSNYLPFNEIRINGKDHYCDFITRARRSIARRQANDNQAARRREQARNVIVQNIFDLHNSERMADRIVENIQVPANMFYGNEFNQRPQPQQQLQQQPQQQQPQPFQIGDHGIIIERVFPSIHIINNNNNVNNVLKPNSSQLKIFVARGFKRLTDRALSYMNNLRLELLDVTGTGVTSEGIKTFLMTNPDCRVIHESTCKCKPDF